MITSEERAWAAGFFDGEGCVSLHTRTRRKSPEFRFEIVVGQKNPKTLRWLQDRWGGKLRFLKAPNESWELRWRRAAEARVFLEDILPYLKEKTEHVRLGLDFIGTVGAAGGAAMPERHKHRMEIRNKLQAVIHSSGFLNGVKAGVAALNEGRITPWENVKRELWPDEDPGK